MDEPKNQEKDDELRNSRFSFESVDNHYFFKTDIEGYFTYVNPTFYERFKALVPEMIGSYSMKLIHPDDHQKTIDTVEKCFAFPGRSFDVIIRKPLFEDKFVWNHWDFTAICNEEGHPIGIQGVGHDISARKQLSFITGLDHQDVLKLLEQIEEGFFAVDHKWQILFVNTAFEMIIGRKRENLLFKNLWEQFPEARETKIFTMYHKAMIGQQKVRFEEYFAPLDKWLSAVAYPSLHGGLYVFFSDISQHKKFEKQILFQNDKLKEIAFLQSHNMRVPVANILGILDLLETVDQEEKPELLSALQESAQKMDDIIHHITSRIYEVERNDGN